LVAGTGQALEASAVGDQPVSISKQLAMRAFAGGTDLLPQEDPTTLIASDARRWSRIYGELVEFKNELFWRLDGKVDGLTPEAQTELRSTDLAAIVEQRARYQDRLDFWYSRHWELHGLDLDADALVARHNGIVVDLTRREFELLSFLLDHPGRLHSSEQLASQAWGDHRLSAEEVRTYLARVRHKITELQIPCRLENKPRRGYVLVFTD
jgi:hypothetical protein